MPDDTVGCVTFAATAGVGASEDQFFRFLIDRGTITAADLSRARNARAGDDRLSGVMTRLGVVSEQALAEAFAAYLELPVAGTAQYPELMPLCERLSARFLKTARIVPLRDDPEALIVAMADPLDDEAAQALSLAVRKPVAVMIGIPADIDAALQRIPGSARVSSEEVHGDVQTDDQGNDEDIERLKDLASEAPVIRLVNLLISDAVEARASDVHIESFESRLRVRYRIDGRLQEVEGPPRRLAAAVLSRIKIMAKLNIAERRLPQDGRMKIVVRGKDIDLRVATLPTLHGENAVLRILDRGTVSFDFEALGFSEAALKQYLALLRRPHGILLVTGPTGSGKTTTLYASLLALNAPSVKILTVEDPIEYQLDGINQVQIKPQIDLTFANALRSLLRQDPDIVMIGEIRDTETARIAVQAALTGHLVLSTLHTNDAASTIGRLLDMGIEDYLINSTLNGVVAQRLVRRLCLHCRERRPAPDGGAMVYEPTGCAHCGGSGYRGRCTVVELLAMSDSLRSLVAQRADGRAIAHCATREGMRTMFEDGLMKAREGITSLDEVFRTTRGEADGALPL